MKGDYNMDDYDAKYFGLDDVDDNDETLNEGCTCGGYYGTNNFNKVLEDIEPYLKGELK